jgi:hypothetical protein
VSDSAVDGTAGDVEGCIFSRAASFTTCRVLRKGCGKVEENEKLEGSERESKAIPFVHISV